MPDFSAGIVKGKGEVTVESIQRYAGSRLNKQHFLKRFDILPSNSGTKHTPASHIEPIGGSNSTVPQARILYCALLVAKVRIDQPIPLGIALRPLEVVEKGPGMKGTNPSSVGDRASQFREHLAIPLDATAVGYAAVFFFIGSIEIPAAALGNFDDRVVVLP
jgi:hypothetical protein